MTSFAAPDTVLLQKIQKELQDIGIDAFICRLSENVNFLTGYWPVLGASVVVFPATGMPSLIVPQEEVEFTWQGWVTDVRTYPFSSLDSLPNPNDSLARLVMDVCREKRIASGQLGFEGSFEMVSAIHIGGDIRLPAAPFRQMLHNILPSALYRDVTAILSRLRMAKTPVQIERVRLANEIASMGLDAAREMVRPGMTEVELATLIEQAAETHGTGYKQVRRVRAWAYVMSGPASADAWKPFNLSTNRAMEEGDHAFVEMATVVDGYWSDLTRVLAVGRPSERAQRIWAAIRDSQAKALAAIRPGIHASTVDRISREALDSGGYSPHFLHPVGHGVGFACHESPTLHPASHDILEAGIIHSVEPGVYIEGWGGLRLEDNVVVTPQGAECLSTASREL